MTDPRKPHVHAEVIKAWADGAEIQWRHGPKDPWLVITKPGFVPQYEYRVKPPPHKWQAVMDAYKAGKKCQWRHTNPKHSCHSWHDMTWNGTNYGWYTDGNYEYRIKPEQVVKYANAYDVYIGSPEVKGKWYHNKDAPNYAGALQLTFEEGKLIAAEVLS